MLFRSGLSLSSFLGLIGCGFPLQTNTTVTRRHWMRMLDRDGKDIFRLSRAAIRPRLFKPSSPKMGSLYHDRVRSFRRSISARNSPLLHKPPGTGRGRYPFGHPRLGARFCLNIPYDRNGDRRIFIGQSQYKRFQIGKDHLQDA